MAAAFTAYTMDAIWAQVGTLVSLAVVVGLSVLGISLRYGKRLIRFIQSL